MSETVPGHADHERIWLQNAEDARNSDTGRMWCEDKVWPDEDGEGEPTEYIRADLSTPIAAHGAGAVTEAAQALLKKLREIHDNDTYKSVWVVAQLHCGSYTGPKYDKELEALEAALAAALRPVEDSARVVAWRCRECHGTGKAQPHKAPRLPESTTDDIVF